MTLGGLFFYICSDKYKQTPQGCCGKTAKAVSVNILLFGVFFKVGRSVHLKCSIWYRKFVMVLNKLERLFNVASFKWGWNSKQSSFTTNQWCHTWNPRGHHLQGSLTEHAKWISIGIRLISGHKLVPPSQFCRLFGTSVATESFEGSQQLILSGSVWHHIAVLLQQDAV